MPPSLRVDLGFQKLHQIAGKVDDATFVILGRAGVQTQRAGIEVKLVPLKGEDLLCIRQPSA